PPSLATSPLSLHDALPIYFPALFAFSTFTLQTVWLGQVSLITATALQAVWYLDRKRRPIAGGMCLALASLKPQIMMLPLVWFLRSEEHTSELQSLTNLLCP